VIVALSFLVHVLVGGTAAHYRVDPGVSYGMDLTQLLPGNILRTWHLQLAIFWNATAYMAGWRFLALAVGEGAPKVRR
jgi:nitric oxide reductase subunit B